LESGNFNFNFIILTLTYHHKKTAVLSPLVNKCRCLIAYKEIAAAVTEELVVLAIFSGDFEKKCRQWFWQFLVGRLYGKETLSFV
jgi:hypothetical protein